MLLLTLILFPFFGAGFIMIIWNIDGINIKIIKSTALFIAIMELVFSLMIWVLYDNSCKYFQFVQVKYDITHFDFYLGIDALSIYFILLTTLILPIAIISNWKSINDKNIYFLAIMIFLEGLLLLIFLALDGIMFYIFFESILAPLFILIGLFGSNEKIRASFYFFLYTFFGSLFMLLAIIAMLFWIGTTDYEILSKINFTTLSQIFMFIGVLIAFAVKTPVIFLNGWLLKAHVESPLSGSIILAAIVLKLAIYGIFRLMLPFLPKAFLNYTYVIFLIGVITILYASLSTLRTIDLKELIAYSSVSHAAVYLGGVISNTIHGIQGGICLGLAHGFVSSGLFASGGGVLYDRSSTRLITIYKGMAQAMPIFAVLFFILSLGNCGAPLTLNFIGEFMSLYGVFERLTLAGVFASSSIVLSAAYTIYMFNRIVFGGSFSKFWTRYVPDINQRENIILLILVVFTVILGIYPSIILDGLNYSLYFLVFTFDDISYKEIITFATDDKATSAITSAVSSTITQAGPANVAPAVTSAVSSAAGPSNVPYAMTGIQAAVEATNTAAAAQAAAASHAVAVQAAASHAAALHAASHAATNAAVGAAVHAPVAPQIDCLNYNCTYVSDVRNLVLFNQNAHILSTNLPGGFVEEDGQPWIFQKVAGKPAGKVSLYHTFQSWSIDGLGPTKRLDFTRTVKIYDNLGDSGCLYAGKQGTVEFQTMAVKMKYYEEGLFPPKSDLINNR